MVERLFKRTIALTAGGTGGHLLPAKRLARRLQQQLPGQPIVWFGQQLDSPLLAPLFRGEEALHPFEVAAPSLKKGALLARGRALLTHGQSFLRSLQLLRRLHCCCLVGFGSYQTLPVMLAGKALSLPLLLYEANAVPGRIIRLFAPKAKMTAIQFSASGSHLKGALAQVRWTTGLQTERLDERASSANYFGLQKELPILLVAGGSQGARAINELMGQLATNWPTPSLQLLHLTGSEQVAAALSAHYAQCGVQACVKAFEMQMEKALGCADLYVGRAGAATVAELVTSQLPALLIPYPHASDDHQWANGQEFVDRLGGGWLWREAEATPERLRSLLKAIWVDKTSPLEPYRERLRQSQGEALPSMEELLLAQITQLLVP